MKDFKVLKFLDRFKRSFEKMGVDYPLMRRILQLKLTMDERRVPTALANSNKKKKKQKDEKNFKSSLWIYALMGIILIPFVVMKANYMYQMSFVFGILMFMVMTSMISDFSSVLLDVRDRNIMHSKPVDAKTLSVAKVLHVCIYMFMLTMSLAGPALAVSLIRQGPAFFVIFLLELILMDVFIVVLTAILYFLILKFFDGEKLKDIINYVQIILSITMAIGYQFIGRVFSITSVNVAFSPKWWNYLIFPIWFSAPFELFLKGSRNMHVLVFSLLALIVPIISIMVYMSITPAFERNLQKLNNNSARRKSEKGGLQKALCAFLCSGKEERTFFNFASQMMRNEREFKLKVYPSLGFAIIFPFIFLFNVAGKEGFSSMASGKAYLNIYLCAFMLPTLILMMKYSASYKGAWIYKVMPMKDVSPAFKGTFKAFITKLLLPVYLVDCVAFVMIFGVRIVPDLFLVFINMIFFTILCFSFTKKSLPFSISTQDANQSEGLIVIPLMFALGALVLVHYFCTLKIWGIYALMAVMVILDFVLWNRAFKISWDKLVK